MGSARLLTWHQTYESVSVPTLYQTLLGYIRVLTLNWLLESVCVSHLYFAHQDILLAEDSLPLFVNKRSCADLQSCNCCHCLSRLTMVSWRSRTWCWRTCTWICWRSITMTTCTSWPPCWPGWVQHAYLNARAVCFCCCCFFFFARVFRQCWCQRCFYNHSMHPVAFVSFALYFCRIDVRKTFPQALSAAVASSSDSAGFCHIESVCDGDTLLQQRRPSGFRAG